MNYTYIMLSYSVTARVCASFARGRRVDAVETTHIASTRVMLCRSLIGVMPGGVQLPVIPDCQIGHDRSHDGARASLSDSIRGELNPVEVHIGPFRI